MFAGNCHRNYLSTGCAATSAPTVAGILQKLGLPLSLAVLGHGSGAATFRGSSRFEGEQGERRTAAVADRPACMTRSARASMGTVSRGVQAHESICRKT